MKVDSRYVGSPLKPYRCAIFQRDTMNFAAGVADQNPIYFDDLNTKGIVAHPMHCVAVTWPIIERIHEYIEVKDFPLEILATQVHYTEQLIIHRLIKPGDQLLIKGTIAAILPHRSGTHMVICLEAFDQDNTPVFTEYMGGLMRGVQCSDQGQGKENIPQSFSKEMDTTPSWESTLMIDPLLPFVYDGCTRIHFPIHTSRQFAQQVGLPDIILQGTATLTLAVKEIINREAQADPQQIKSISCHFTGMVMPGTTITLQVKSCDVDGNVFFQVLNSRGKPAISYGHINLKR